MNDKDMPKTSREQDSINSSWKFCPICGNQLPNIQNLKFCTVCGTDIQYIKDNKKLNPENSSNPYKSPTLYPQYTLPRVSYGPELIEDEDLIGNKDHKLWGAVASIGVPLAALFVMNGLVGGFLSLLMVLSNDINFILNLDLNSYLTSLISVFELIFLIFPILYVRKYLKNPTLKNRLIFLGFTTKNYDKKRISKEILIGLGFAIIGVLVVTISSIGVELILEILLGINIIHDTSGLTGGPIPLDLLSFIIFSVVVILIVGTSEEILFRGFMQKGLVRSIGNRWGIIVTALIFSLIHLFGLFIIALETPYLFLISFLLSFAPYFSISLMLGLLYHWRSENLIAVMITHGVYDVLAILMTYFLYGMF
jgi:membrane protease YdiL (CAAX protease family)